MKETIPPVNNQWIDISQCDFTLKTDESFATKTGKDITLEVNGYNIEDLKIEEIVWDMSDYEDIEEDRGRLSIEIVSDFRYNYDIDFEKAFAKSNNPKQYIHLFGSNLEIESNNTPISTEVYVHSDSKINLKGVGIITFFAGDANTINEFGIKVS